MMENIVDMQKCICPSSVHVQGFMVSNECIFYCLQGEANPLGLSLQRLLFQNILAGLDHAQYLNDILQIYMTKSESLPRVDELKCCIIQHSTSQLSFFKDCADLSNTAECR